MRATREKLVSSKIIIAAGYYFLVKLESDKYIQDNFTIIA